MKTKPIIIKQPNTLLSFYNTRIELVVWVNTFVNLVMYVYYLTYLCLNKFIGVEYPKYTVEPWFENLFNYIIFFFDANCLSVGVLTYYFYKYKPFTKACIFILWGASLINFIKLSFNSGFDPYVVFASCVLYAGILSIVFAKITNRF